MSSNRIPEIEFVLSPEQKTKAADVLNSLMMSPYTSFQWDSDNYPHTPFHIRIVAGVGWAVIHLTDSQIVDILKQLMDGIEYKSTVIDEILVDVTE